MVRISFMMIYNQHFAFPLGIVKSPEAFSRRGWNTDRKWRSHFATAVASPAVSLAGR